MRNDEMIKKSFGYQVIRVISSPKNKQAVSVRSPID